LAATALVLSLPALEVERAGNGIASAATAAPVPVVGVGAFGYGRGQLVNPQDLAVSPQGDLFVSSENDEIVEFAPTPGTTSYAATGTVVAGSGTALSGPSGLAFDASGDLFVSYTAENEVLEFAYNGSTGTYPSIGTVVAGTGAVGSAPNELSGPSGIALDSKGDLFVVDTGNSRVEEFTYNSSTEAYASNAIDVAGTGVAGTGANYLTEPNDVVLDNNGDLFIADTGNVRVMEYQYNSSAGTYSSSGTEVVGSLPSSADWLAFDSSGNLFVSYMTSAQTELSAAFSTAASFSTTAAGSSTAGGVLEFPYSPATGTYASSGTSIGSATSLVNPAGLVFNSSGDLLLAETSNPNTVTTWNLVLELIYNSSAGTFSPLGTILADNASSETGISAVDVDSKGNLFVSDTFSQTGSSSGVFEFPYDPISKTYSVTGSLISATGGAALALDANNDLFVAGTTGVLEFPWSSTTASYAANGIVVPGATQLSNLTVAAMALDSTGDLFVASANEVLEFPYSSSTGTWAASGSVVATVTPGTLPSGYTSYIQGIAGVALDSSGDLFVSNPSASQVLEFSYSPSTKTYSTTGLLVAGQGGTGDGLAQLYEPAQLALDSNDDLYVVDAGNNRVMELTPYDGGPTYNDNGTQLFAGPSLSLIGHPDNAGIALDPQGDVFFGNDYPSGAVYEVTASSGTSPTTTASTTSSTSPSTSTSTSTATTSSTSSTTTIAPTTTVAPRTTTTVAPTTTTTHATTTTRVAPTTTTTHATTTTTVAPTTTTTHATTTTTVAPTTTTVASVNLIPDPGFETTAVPIDYWGSTLALTTTVVHSGSQALAQTLTSSSGGWDLDDNSSWYAPISSAHTYSSAIWVRATAAVKVDIGVDLLTSSGSYVDTVSGAWVTLGPNTWTELTVSGITPSSGEVYAGMEPDFSKATKGTVIYWDDMSLIS
jgi:sugar lactone lactonase YvrE